MVMGEQVSAVTKQLDSNLAAYLTDITTSLAQFCYFLLAVQNKWKNIKSVWGGCCSSRLFLRTFIPALFEIFFVTLL